MIRFRHLSLAVSVALCSVAAQAHAEDLLQVYGEARASDPQLAGAEASRNATNEGVDQARSALLPQISASLDYSRGHGSRGGPQFVTNEDGSQSLVNVTSSSHDYSRTLSGQLNQSLLDQPGVEEALGAATPLGRVGTAGEVARVIVFLLSDEAAYVTGQNVVVDGGSLLPNSQVDPVLGALLGPT